MTQPFQIPTEFRDFAEKSVDQARTAIDTLLGNAVKAAEQAQANGQSFQTNLQSAVSKGFDFAHTNANATFDFAHKLVRSKDLKEAYELHTDFVKSQIAALQAQAKEFGSIAQKSAN